jgi:hypothetical protein
VIVTDLIRQLEDVVDKHGWNCRVVTITNGFVFPFTISVDPKLTIEGKSPVVLIRVATWNDQASAEQQQTSPGVTDHTPTNSPR